MSSPIDTGIRCRPTAGSSNWEAALEGSRGLLLDNLKPTGEPADAPADEPAGEPTSALSIDNGVWIALVCSLLALAVAIVTITVNTIAWRLRYTKQIVVVGFLLGIMNICMMKVLPSLFLRCEARCGQSTLQNYEAILRNTPLASKVSWGWRVALVLTLALPLGLSVVYKLYNNGRATITISPDHVQYTDSFGMFSPPGVQPLGFESGTILMYNITMAFMKASTNQTAPRDRQSAQLLDEKDEVKFPDKTPQAYGFNTLLLNATASALLDVPRPDWISAIQSSLSAYDHWEFSAAVLATVASRNGTVDAHRNEDVGSPFWSQIFHNGNGGKGDIEYKFFGPGLWQGFLANYLTTASSRQPDGAWCILSQQKSNDSTDFIQGAQLWDISRQYCQGRWRITQSDMRLLDGTCNPEDRPSNIPSNQMANLVLTQTGASLFLSNIFAPALAELLLFFGEDWSSRTWGWPTMAVSMASMYWSRIAVVIGPGSPHWGGNNSFAAGLISTGLTDNNTTDGLLYNRPVEITSTRRVLEKSLILYLVLAVQPLITILAFFASVTLLRRMPVGWGFGMTAILAGADRESTAVLRGAGFSGTLDRPVHLVIFPDETSDGGPRVLYNLSNLKPPKVNRISPTTSYL
ncbi:hypothetical protein K431DRAFT_310744 [Polychaeton citri CBS 116435]|uniref:Uncharacterized protein n=1 Tax=Polychaeton citri CBS 116435 TaxID=1314669 RepID=A0A9P4USG8_9PEZI|nr:hypothetical protein K431DRAFT_310744 [Polychaeton citri CBS 116435]